MSESSHSSNAVSGITVWPFRFCLLARAPIYFPEGKATNVLRGAFGSLFRKLCCAPECMDATQCDIAASCPYARAFEPKQSYRSQSGPSGLQNWPRPFVFRAQQLDGARFQAGEGFWFDAILFQQPKELLPYFVLAFRELAGSGLGPARGSVALTTVEDLASGKFVYENQSFTSAVHSGIFFDLTAPQNASNQTFHIDFLTPTELKADGQIAGHPEFSILFSRLRDRISNLCACYQGGALAIDFKSLGNAAKQIVLRSDSGRHLHIDRQSSRTGQRHSIGGFAGRVEYCGNLGPFLPFLKAGEWTGVGRQTVWGKGRFRLHS